MNSENLYSTSVDCIVPKCLNKKCLKSSKLFFEVPSDVELRNKWKAAIHNDFGENPHYVCEDHFNLEEDVIGSVLKEDVIPHRFEDLNRRKMKQQQFEVQINGKKHVLKGTILPASAMISKLDLSKIIIKKPTEGIKIAPHEEKDAGIAVEDNKPTSNVPINFQIDFSASKNVSNFPILESKNLKIIKAGSGNTLGQKKLHLIKIPNQTNSKQIHVLSSTNIPSKILNTTSNLERNLQDKVIHNNLPTEFGIVNQDSITDQANLVKSRIINQSKKLLTKPLIELTKIKFPPHSENQQKLKKAFEKKVVEMNTLNAEQLEETDPEAPIEYYPIEEIELSPKEAKIMEKVALKQRLIPGNQSNTSLSPMERPILREDDKLWSKNVPIMVKKSLKELPIIMKKDLLGPKKVSQLKDNQSSSKEWSIIMEKESTSLIESSIIMENELLGSKKVSKLKENESSPKELPVIMETESTMENPIMENELSSPIIMENKLSDSVQFLIVKMDDDSTSRSKELPIIMENKTMEKTMMEKELEDATKSMEFESISKKLPIILNNESIEPMETSLTMEKQVLCSKEAPKTVENKSITRENATPNQVQFYIIKMENDPVPTLNPNVLENDLQTQPVNQNELLLETEKRDKNATHKRAHASYVYSSMAERDKIVRNYRNPSFLKRLRLNKGPNSEEDSDKIGLDKATNSEEDSDCGSNDKISKIDAPSSSRSKTVDFVEDETGVKSKIVKYGKKKYVIKIGVLDKDGSKETPVENELEKELENERNAKKSTAHVLSQMEISKIIRNYNDKSDLKKMKEINAKKYESTDTKIDKTAKNALRKSVESDNNETELKSNIVTHDNKKYVIKMGVLNKDSSLKNKKISKVIQCSNIIKKIMIKNKDDPTTDVLNDTTHKIANIPFLLGQFKTIAMHNIADKDCSLSNTNFISKISDGLSTQLYLKCKGCQKVFKIFLTDKNSSSKLNISAVSSSVKTGIGYGGFKALCTGIGVKPLFQNTFNCYTDMLSRINDHNKVANFDPSTSKFEQVTVKQENFEDINEYTEINQPKEQNSRTNVPILRNVKKPTNSTMHDDSSSGSSSDFANDEPLEQNLTDVVIVKEENIDTIKDEIDFNCQINYS